MHLINDAYYIAVRMQYPHSLEPRGNNHRPNGPRHRCGEVHADRAIRLDEPRRVKWPDKGRARRGSQVAGTSNPPAFRGGLGDFTSGNLTASTGTAFIGPFDSARFVQSDGSVSVDFAASMTGTIWAVIVPARF